MREVGNKQQVMDEVVLFCNAAVNIDQKCDLSEGEEGDAQRQNNIQRWDVTTEKLIG